MCLFSPLSDATGTEVDLGIQGPKESPVFLPEGSTIDIWKPELCVKFLPVDSISGHTDGPTSNDRAYSIPGETIIRKIKPWENVLSIKGVAVDRIKELLSTNASIDFDQIIVARSNDKMFNDEQALDVVKLCDDQMLVDFVIESEKLVVQYTEGQITFRERVPSLELEEDFFALFVL